MCTHTHTRQSNLSEVCFLENRKMLLKQRLPMCWVWSVGVVNQQGDGGYISTSLWIHLHSVSSCIFHSYLCLLYGYIYILSLHVSIVTSVSSMDTSTFCSSCIFHSYLCLLYGYIYILSLHVSIVTSVSSMDTSTFCLFMYP